MARISYIPHNQDREDQRLEDRADRRAQRDIPLDHPSNEDLERFGANNPDDEEFSSVLAFLEYLLDNDQPDFTHNDLACLNYRTGIPTRAIKFDLESVGLIQRPRERHQAVRGFTSNPHDRWIAYPSHGGSGGASISGMSDP